MLRLLATASVVFSLFIFAGPAAAADCELCLDAVALQTRDGQPWTAGNPVTLVVHIADRTGTPLPPSARVVVMQTDGDRTKCLDVPLKLVQSDASGGVYAGLFFPFRPARYDGKLAVGNDLQDIRFDVSKMAAGAAPAGELPTAKPIDTSLHARTVFPAWQLPAAGAAVLAFLVLTVVVIYSRRRRLALPTAM